MASKRPDISNSLEMAVNCFRPILQRLRIRDESSIGRPVFLASFPHLWNYNIEKWVITIIKTDLKDPKVRAKFMSQYHKRTGIMESYIILDDVFFMDSVTSNEIRKAIAVHEFCHFVALIYASICSTTEETLLERLKARLSNVVDVLTDEQVLKLYKLLNNVRPLSNDFSDFEQTKDEHFRLDCEDLALSYTDLFKNFLISRQMLDEYFCADDKKRFAELFQSEKADEAIKLYIGIANKLAEEKWLPKKFAVNRAIDILTDFYFKELFKTTS